LKTAELIEEFSPNDQDVLVWRIVHHLGSAVILSEAKRSRRIP
jgi:hypothetical protein